MGKASRKKQERRLFSPPDHIECQECGTMCIVTYVPKDELMSGITAIGFSKCGSCGVSHTHTAGDPAMVGKYLEFLEGEIGEGTMSLTDMAGRAVRDRTPR